MTSLQFGIWDIIGNKLMFCPEARQTVKCKDLSQFLCCSGVDRQWLKINSPCHIHLTMETMFLEKKALKRTT